MLSYEYTEVTVPYAYVSVFLVSSSSLLQSNKSRSMVYALILQEKMMDMSKKERRSLLLLPCGSLIFVGDVVLVWCNDLEFQRVWIMGALLPSPM